MNNRTVRSRPHATWYTDNSREIKRHLRKAERKSRKTLLYTDSELFVAKRYEYKRSLAKREFYRDKFHQCDTRQLFQLVNNLVTLWKKLVLQHTIDSPTL